LGVLLKNNAACQVLCLGGNNDVTPMMCNDLDILSKKCVDEILDGDANKRSSLKMNIYPNSNNKGDYSATAVYNVVCCYNKLT
jgi:hypothetical protein